MEENNNESRLEIGGSEWISFLSWESIDVEVQLSFFDRTEKYLERPSHVVEALAYVVLPHPDFARRGR